MAVGEPSGQKLPPAATAVDWEGLLNEHGLCACWRCIGLLQAWVMSNRQNRTENEEPGEQVGS